MRKLITTTFLTALLASPMALADNRQLDPIFQITPVSGQADAGCFDNTVDNRNIFVRGATSTAGQTIIGGLLGAALGNQFGDGRGKDIATGVGAAVGASAGAYNANRQREARIRECQQYQGYAQNGSQYNGQYSNQYDNQYGNQYAGQNYGNSGVVNSYSNSGSYNLDAARGYTPNR